MPTSFCPAACTSDELIANPAATCTTTLRENSIARIGFKLCGVSVPRDIDDVAFKALVDDGSIVFSSELANFAPSAPEYQDVKYADCKPPIKRISRRVIEIEDRIAVNSVSSPTNPFGDYEFHQDKVDLTGQINIMFVYCNGDIVPAMDRNGDWLSVSYTAFLDWDNSTSSNGAAAIEFKKISMDFAADPFALYNTPIVNAELAGIVF